jgi:hypothetical protein
MLTLPKEYAPRDLVIPTRFAATAQFLVDAGMIVTDDDSAFAEGWYNTPARTGGKNAAVNVPGLFRIPGSKITTDRLRAFFEWQIYDGGGTLEDFHRTSHEIEYTVRLAALPNQSVIPYQIHDVASCFKSFLADLDGGLLGSINVFEGLRKVVLPQRLRKSTDSADLEWKCVGVAEGEEDEEPIDPRHIARILCGIKCAAKRYLILAVFGLLAYFMADDAPLDQRCVFARPPSTGIPVPDGMRESCFPARVPHDARMTAEFSAASLRHLCSARS